LLITSDYLVIKNMKEFNKINNPEEVEKLNFNWKSKEVVPDLSKFVRLKVLYINPKADVADGNSLAFCSKLEKLSIFPQCSHIDFLKNLTLLRELTICFSSESEPIDISSLEGLTDLVSFTAFGLNTNDTSSLKKLTKLNKLYLSRCNNLDLHHISDLFNLKTLFIRDCNISDLSAIKSLKFIENLIVDGNQISDISPIRELVNLTSLTISHNPIESIEIIKELPKLKILI